MRTDNAASSERKQNHAYERQRLQKETKSHARTEDTAQKNGNKITRSSGSYKSYNWKAMYMRMNLRTRLPLARKSGNKIIQELPQSQGTYPILNNCVHGMRSACTGSAWLTITAAIVPSLNSRRPLSSTRCCRRHGARITWPSFGCRRRPPLRCRGRAIRVARSTG
jgi:hypothetical protein